MLQQQFWCVACGAGHTIHGHILQRSAQRDDGLLAGEPGGMAARLAQRPLPPSGLFSAPFSPLRTCSSAVRRAIRPSEKQDSPPRTRLSPLFSPLHAEAQFSASCLFEDTGSPLSLRWPAVIDYNAKAQGGRKTKGKGRGK